MPKLSILIPSRNEKYLTKTVEDCFAKAKGETEVVVTLEGAMPEGWKEVVARFPNLHTIHHSEPRGMRPAINAAAASAISRGAKYLMKLDAHCMLDEGFDTKLLADIEPNWIVVPRRKRLDAENWTLQDVGKPDIDYHYLSFPDDPNDFGGPGLNGKVWTGRIIARKDDPQYEIDDEMSSQGSCWVVAASYFEELELMDTATFGPFWCEAQEVLMKAWLSGGRCVVNKKTWYAHLHKGRSYAGEDGKRGRGYHLPEKWLSQGRNAAMKWLHNDIWPKQTLPFKTLIERFWPVPGWSDNWEELVYGKERNGRLVQGVGNNDGDDIRDLSSRAAVTTSGLIIHSATYGLSDDDNIDVTARVRSLVKGNSLDIGISNAVLVPGDNPWRGKKKRLRVTYSYDGGEPVTVIREEKDALIIGQVRRQGIVAAQPAVNDAAQAMSGFGKALAVLPIEAKNYIADEKTLSMSATALNDLLIRRFKIPDRRLRGPMPIEIPTFHRDDLAKLFAELGFNKGAEIGVAEGNYSEVLLKANPQLELHLVDPWHHYSGNPQGKSKEKNEFAYNETKRKTASYPNVKIHGVMSMTAVQVFDDGELDFVYIDGHHGFDYVMQDLIEWFKRVRSGGIVAGDDYFFINAARWGAGVVEAVQAYTSAHKINPWFICNADRSTDYFWVKR
jgi:hypothetical protein